jgi:DNA helicase-2/ATP-dependent DNA helicase PcrA
LKVLVHPGDEPSLMRIINVPARGIGQTTVKRLLEEAIRRGKPLGDVLADVEELTGKRTDKRGQNYFSAGEQHFDGQSATKNSSDPFFAEGLPAAAVQSVARFHAMIERFRREMREKPPVNVVKSLIAEIAYKEELARQYPDVNEQEARWASVEELVNAVAGYSRRAAEPTPAGFLQEVALTGNEGDQDKESKLERNAVALLTLHAAKGLEFPEVYMAGMEEGTLPHHRSVSEAGAAVDEERRLCYVGVTRAKRRLTLTMALSRHKWGKARPTHSSRFLYELTGQADHPNYEVAKTSQGRARRAGSGRK